MRPWKQSDGRCEEEGLVMDGKKVAAMDERGGKIWKYS